MSRSRGSVWPQHPAIDPGGLQELSQRDAVDQPVDVVIAEPGGHHPGAGLATAGDQFLVEIDCDRHRLVRGNAAACQFGGDLARRGGDGFGS